MNCPIKKLKTDANNEQKTCRCVKCVERKFLFCTNQFSQNGENQEKNGTNVTIQISLNFLRLNGKVNKRTVVIQLEIEDPRTLPRSNLGAVAQRHI